MKDLLRHRIDSFVKAIREQRECDEFRPGRTRSRQFIWQNEFFRGDDWYLTGAEGEYLFRLVVYSNEGEAVYKLTGSDYDEWHEILTDPVFIRSNG